MNQALLSFQGTILTGRWHRCTGDKLTTQVVVCPLAKVQMLARSEAAVTDTHREHGDVGYVVDVVLDVIEPDTLALA